MPKKLKLLRQLNALSLLPMPHIATIGAPHILKAELESGKRRRWLPCLQVQSHYEKVCKVQGRHRHCLHHQRLEASTTYKFKITPLKFTVQNTTSVISAKTRSSSKPADIEHLPITTLSKLSLLYIAEVKLKDTKPIAELKSLREVYSYGCGWTEADKEYLKNSIPNLSF